MLDCGKAVLFCPRSPLAHRGVTVHMRCSCTCRCISVHEHLREPSSLLFLRSACLSCRISHGYNPHVSASPELELEPGPPCSTFKLSRVVGIKSRSTCLLSKHATDYSVSPSSSTLIIRISSAQAWLHSNITVYFVRNVPLE